MKRKIKFRGISRKTNNFVYGMLMYSVSDSGLVIVETVDCPPTMQDPCGDTINIYHGIIPGTESQFTGMLDKDEKEIYENDIISFHYFFLGGGEEGVWESEHELKGIIVWGIYGWAVDAINGEHWCSYTGYKDGEGDSSILDLQMMNESSIHEESFEVIGNIHHNSELLNSFKKTEN
jgi:uncharacterized phage protein (TIGR01671 family)